MNGRKALAVLLVLIGGLALLKFIGINLGAIFGAVFGFLLPFILIGFGILGWINGKKVIGGILAAIGAFMLLAKLGGLIMLILAIGLVVVGIGMLKNDKRSF